MKDRATSKAFGCLSDRVRFGQNLDECFIWVQCYSDKNHENMGWVLYWDITVCAQLNNMWNKDVRLLIIRLEVFHSCALPPIPYISVLDFSWTCTSPCYPPFYYHILSLRCSRAVHFKFHPQQRRNWHFFQDVFKLQWKTNERRTELDWRDRWDC